MSKILVLKSYQSICHGRKEKKDILDTRSAHQEALERNYLATGEVLSQHAARLVPKHLGVTTSKFIYSITTALCYLNLDYDLFIKSLNVS